MRLELNRKCEGCNFWGSYLWQGHWLCEDCLPSRAQEVLADERDEQEREQHSMTLLREEDEGRAHDLLTDGSDE